MEYKDKQGNKVIINNDNISELLKPYKLDSEYVAYKLFDKLFMEGYINLETYEKIQKEFKAKYGDKNKSK